MLKPYIFSFNGSSICMFTHSHDVIKIHYYACTPGNICLVSAYCITWLYFPLCEGYLRNTSHITAVIVGTGFACAVFGVIVASLMIGILFGVCRLKKYKARKKRHVCVHTNVMYFMTLYMCVHVWIYVAIYFVYMCLCSCCDIMLLLYGLNIIL